MININTKIAYISEVKHLAIQISEYDSEFTVLRAITNTRDFPIAIGKSEEMIALKNKIRDCMLDNPLTSGYFDMDTEQFIEYPEKIRR